MGRTEGLYESGVMTANEVARHILERCNALISFDAYMFGSTLNGVGKDIDILVVGPGGPALSNLKYQIHLAGENLPLHLLYMQPSEARRTKFVTRENCIPLLHLASADARI